MANTAQPKTVHHGASSRVTAGIWMCRIVLLAAAVVNIYLQYLILEGTNGLNEAHSSGSPGYGTFH